MRVGVDGGIRIKVWALLSRQGLINFCLMLMRSLL